MSATPVAVMFQTTSDEDTGIRSPLGKVQITPVPIVAGNEILRKKYSGTVGGVPQASAVWTVPAGSPGSSAITVTGVVGVPPIACGLPRPKVEAVAAARKMPISMILGLSVEVVRISKVGFALVTLVVLFAKL
jgi:hypothetical protein